jgi:hypothetical protein
MGTAGLLSPVYYDLFLFHMISPPTPDDFLTACFELNVPRGSSIGIKGSYSIVFSSLLLCPENFSYVGLPLHSSTSPQIRKSTGLYLDSCSLG